MTRMKCLREIAVLAALLVSLPAGLMTTTSPSASIMSAEWTDHGAIFINDNSKFISENGVVSGNGTRSDPYVIAGWRIGPSPNRTAIAVQDTTAYFSVRNVYVFSCSIGVFMTGVSNGKVESSQFIDDEVGVAAYESHSCKVTGNVFERCQVAISISYSDVSQSDNTFTNNGKNVMTLKAETPPWEQTWVGATVCVSSLILLAVAIALIVYIRLKQPIPPAQ